MSVVRAVVATSKTAASEATPSMIAEAWYSRAFVRVEGLLRVSSAVVLMAATSAIRSRR